MHFLEKLVNEWKVGLTNVNRWTFARTNTHSHIERDGEG